MGDDQYLDEDFDDLAGHEPPQPGPASADLFPGARAAAEAVLARPGPKIEILHVRDPDEGCGLSLFIDGVLTPFDFEDIDPGRGYTLADWVEITAASMAVPGRSAPFLQAIADERAFCGRESRYIEKGDSTPPPAGSHPEVRP